MTARNPGIDRMNLTTGHQLRLFHGTLDGLNGGFDVDHYAFLQPSRRMGTQTHDIDGTVRFNLSDDRHNLGSPDIQADNQILFPFFRHRFNNSPN